MRETTASELARTHAFILAGGRGERLHPLTVSRPKPAVSFGGIFRIIDFTLLNCLYSGLHRVSLLTQYKHEELHRYVRDGWWSLWNQTTLRRTLLVCMAPASGKRYRGTADAVFQNAEVCDLDSEFVLVLSGDHIYQTDYRDLLRQHIETNADVTIATVEHPINEASHFGVVEVDQNFRVTGFEEKPAKPRALPSDASMSLVSSTRSRPLHPAPDVGQIEERHFRAIKNDSKELHQVQNVPSRDARVVIHDSSHERPRAGVPHRPRHRADLRVLRSGSSVATANRWCIYVFDDSASRRCWKIG